MAIDIKSPEMQQKIETMRQVRQRARTDLLYLCRTILGYKDVSWEVHHSILENLQKFEGGKEKYSPEGEVTYTPFVKLEELKGPRSTLILWPRGHLKTTIITIAHTIQWILNYPDVRILISMATGDQVKDVMRELADHFRFNNMFRLFFPDFCPAPRKAKDWGTQDGFIVPNRQRRAKEPTVSSCSIGKVIAGMHYDVEKCSDMVDKENVKTPGQIRDVKNHFSYMEPLTEHYKTPPHHGWKDVEGTIYEFGDLHDDLSKSDKWNRLVEGAVLPGNDLSSDTCKTLWMEKFPPVELRRIRDLPEMSPQQFSAQYLLKPVPPEGGLCDASEIVFLPRKIVSDLMPMLRVHCTIDLHGLEPARNDNDYTVLTMGGFDRDGRLYIFDIRRGRFTPTEVIWHVFDLYQRYPQTVDFKIEKDAHTRVLLPFLFREMSKRQRFPIVVPIKRDTHVSKQQRIRGLQPWFKAGIMRFSADLGCRVDLISEIMQFPSQSSGVHDDILDTLADMMQNREGGVTDDVVADFALDPTLQFGLQRPRDRFIGFREDGSEEWLYGDDRPSVHSPTGFL